METRKKLNWSTCPSSSCWACLFSETAARANKINWCSAWYLKAYDDNDRYSEMKVYTATKEGQPVCLSKHIFSIILFFVFLNIPVYCSHVYYVLVGFFVYPFVKKRNCKHVSKTYKILLKCSFIFMVFVYFSFSFKFYVIIFSQY